MIDKETVAKLHRLYEQRNDLQRCRDDAANKNTWLGVFNDAMNGTGTRGSIVNAVGGYGVLAELTKRAVVDEFERLQQIIDKQITDLGGEA